MSIHSKSLVGFGQVLNLIGQGIAERRPLPQLLDVVKQHFAADVVILAYPGRRGAPCLAADSGFRTIGSECEDNGRRHPLLRGLAETHQHLAAAEPDARRGTECTLWIFRDREAMRFDNEEPALAAIVVAQIARMLDLVERSDEDGEERALYADALGRLGIGALLVDGSGRALTVSAPAARLLARKDALHLQGGRLRAGLAAEDRDLQSVIRTASEAGKAADACEARCLALTKRSGMRTLGLLVRPAEGGLVAVYMRDGEAEPLAESDAVRQVFDLTPAEAAVTRRLVSGLSLEDAAESLAISRNTARAHLRSIFSKNGISRQTELVRMVLNSAVVLGGAAGTAT